MLAAAIRASLIEAGEPDTSAVTPPSASQQPALAPTPTNNNKQHHQQQQQQQQAGLQATPSTYASPFQAPAAEQQSLQQAAQQTRQQQQQWGQKHQLRFEEDELPNGHSFAPEQDLAAVQSRERASALHDTGSTGMAGQGTSPWGSGQTPNGLPGGQLRTARSSDGVVGRGTSAGSLDDTSNSGAGNGADTV